MTSSRMPARKRTTPKGNRYVVFLRAVNVAGHAQVDMAELRRCFESAGCRNVKTVIQSGNVLFEVASRELPATLGRIRSRLEKVLGEEPEILIRSLTKLAALVRSEPFRAHPASPALKRYVVFLARSPRLRPRFPLVSAKEALEALDWSTITKIVALG